MPVGSEKMGSTILLKQPSRSVRRFLATVKKFSPLPISISNVGSEFDLASTGLPNSASASTTNLNASLNASSSSSMLRPRSSVPFMLYIHSLSGLKVPKSIVSSWEIANYSLLVSVSLYSLSRRTFFGSTGVGTPAKVRMSDRGVVDSAVRQSFVFHTSVFDESTVLVIEASLTDGTDKGHSIGWAMLPVFASTKGIDGDVASLYPAEGAELSSSVIPSRVHEIPLQKSTPRILTLFEMGIDSLLSQTRCIGSAVQYAFLSHRELSRRGASRYLRENCIVSDRECIPGLYDPWSQPVPPLDKFRWMMPLSCLFKPLLLEHAPLSLSRLRITIPPAVEQKLLSTIQFVTRQSFGVPSLVVNPHTSGRYLRIGVHSGFSLLSIVTVNLAQSSIGLVAQGEANLKIDGFVPGQGMAVVAEYEVEIVMPTREGGTSPHRIVAAQWIFVPDDESNSGKSEAGQKEVGFRMGAVPVSESLFRPGLLVARSVEPPRIGETVETGCEFEVFVSGLTPSSSRPKLQKEAPATAPVKKENKKQEKVPKKDEGGAGDEIAIISASASVEKSTRPPLPSPVAKEPPKPEPPTPSVAAASVDRSGNRRKHPEELDDPMLIDLLVQKSSSTSGSNDLASLIAPLPRQLLRRFLMSPAGAAVQCTFNALSFVSIRFPFVDDDRAVSASIRDVHDIVLQLWGFQTPDTADASLGRVSFSTSFFVFPPISTLGTPSSLERVSPQSNMLVLVSSQGHLGIEIRFRVDPRSLTPCLRTMYSTYLSSSSSEITVWDADGHFPKGTVSVPWKALLNAVECGDTSVWLALPVVSDIFRGSALKNKLIVRVSAVRVPSSFGQASSVLGTDYDVSSPALPGGAGSRTVRVPRIVERTPALQNAAQFVGPVDVTVRKQLHVERWNQISHVPTSVSDENIAVQQVEDAIERIRTAERQQIISDQLRSYASETHTITLMRGYTRMVETLVKNPYSSPAVFAFSAVEEEGDGRLSVEVSPLRSSKLFRKLQAEKKDYCPNRNPLLDHVVFNETLVDDRGMIALDAHEKALLAVKVSLRDSPVSGLEYEEAEVRFVLRLKNMAGDTVRSLQLVVRSIPHVVNKTIWCITPPRELVKLEMELKGNDNDSSLTANSQRTSGSSFGSRKMVLQTAHGFTHSSWPDTVIQSTDNVKVIAKFTPPPQDSSLWISSYFRRSSVCALRFYDSEEMTVPSYVLNVVYEIPTLYKAMQGTVGQSTRDVLDLPLQSFGTRLVRVMSSEPLVVYCEPKEAFYWSPSTATAIGVIFRPSSTSRTEVLLHWMDVETNEHLMTALVIASAVMPPISKSFDLVVPLVSTAIIKNDEKLSQQDNDTARRGLLKKVAYKNPYPSARTFNLFSSDESVCYMREVSMQVAAREKEYIHMVFPYGTETTPKEVYVFVNDEQDRNEECLHVKVRYA
ncbi:conserved uncharacterized mitochondrial protein [Andalucia godoyi]|uniref:Conserved uncharacterized mitochondrial protein n=1 Tax=Andalucia godoyi TaxID=505711 RepID=A0A8K0AJX8_ANDGO|nr:conserved uncharacterized mitochondrial protein [Andalucia godoyi]|eukprot:ANDGO_08349.mRNA.1 conserved uncharacterized mitochondrial protein